ncbi:hypothetical protein AYI70_g11553 [Smittium culicis]|uniref:Ribosome biogenesis protein NOP53 n=1 Tax=Smittium culicis TaxID=133412 RepID=A0A1R1X1E5_9FUNG|nr:hypothetical protein AYI70_g11553 [Smittium culicis]
MSAEVSTQPKKQRTKASRKSKQSWRKNIDLTAVETGLDETRQELIKSILQSTSKITVPGKQQDTSSEQKQQKHIINQDKKIKKLIKKLEENPNSVAESKRDKKQTKRPRKYDIWSEQAPVASQSKFMVDAVAEHLSKKPKIPQSSIEARNIISPAVILPDPGMSYLPREKDRIDLVKKAAKIISVENSLVKKDESSVRKFKGNDENSVLLERSKVILSEIDNKESEPISSTDKTSKKNRKDSAAAQPAPSHSDEAADNEDDANTVVGDSDQDTGDSDDDDEDDSASDKDLVSSKKPTIRKTQLQRRKEDKLKKKIKTIAGRKTRKIKSRQFMKINKITAEFENELKEKEAARAAKNEIIKQKSLLPKKKIGRYRIKDAEIAVKLGDEVTGSLRTLQTESNLFAEAFSGIQRRNLVEPRIPVNLKRRYALKKTEKWSYKDFK